MFQILFFLSAFDKALASTNTTSVLKKQVHTFIRILR